MIKIDTNTMFISIMILNVFTVFFFFIYIRLYRSQIQKLNFYVLARILQSITWLVYVLKIRQLDSVTMAISMIPLAYGVALEVYCLVTATEKFIKRKFIFLLFVASVYSIVYASVSDIILVRIIVASSFLAFLYAYIWVRLSLQRNNTKMEQVTGWLGFTLGTLFVIRAGGTLWSGIQFDVHSHLFFNILAGLGLFITSAVWPLLFLFLQKENDERLILFKEKKIERDNQKLRRMNATKDKFFSIISHDLRSPFSSILGFLELIITNSEGHNYSKIEKYSKLVYKSAQQTYTLLDNLLQWSKVQTGRIKLKREEFSVSETIENMISLLQTNIDEKNLRLSIEINSGIKLYADKFMIETILRNLLSNAIKFSNEGAGLYLSVRQTRFDTKIEIRDQGVGIDPATLEKLFKEEYNVSAEGTNNEKGSGLGLILCKEFIEKHRGTISVRSELGKGTTVVFVIPSLLREKASV